jgi:lipopolysaccharide/colanic/teichoic acid biosynthesis glycosyltransferase
MAIIGPRPIVEEEVKYYGKNYKTFSKVKPGITGLWQVSGRSNTTYRSRVNLDLYYVNNWSVWMDYFIFLKTIKEVILRNGAE